MAGWPLTGARHCARGRPSPPAASAAIYSLERDHAIGLAIISYDGELVFGVNADRASNPDLDVLTRGLLDEFAALSALARA